MYVCERCKTQVDAKIPATTVPVILRRKRYGPRAQANQLLDPAKPGKHRKIRTDDPGGSGVETARAWQVCPGCAASMPAPQWE